MREDWVCGAVMALIVIVLLWGCEREYTEWQYHKAVIKMADNA